MAEITPEQDAGLRQEAMKRAAADPLPGPLSDAFLKDAVDVGKGIFVRRVVASDWHILKALNSPILRQLLELQKDETLREETEYSDLEQAEMVYQFTHSPKQCRELLKMGREIFSSTSQDYCDTSVDFSQMPMIIAAITKQLSDCISASVSYGAEDLKKKTT
ncbi:MAG: hypothetical protein KGL39_10195 [Patescibacteria group bacterium]|nr:hypothetical protein [Patescibacteria group bacterium]